MVFAAGLLAGWIAAYLLFAPDDDEDKAPAAQDGGERD
jgi:hypothetical protein